MNKVLFVIANAASLFTAYSGGKKNHLIKKGNRVLFNGTGNGINWCKPELI